MDSHNERPLKRARLACEPCRKKKSKCPGEQPICSKCARLRQVCVFRDESALNQPDDEYPYSGSQQPVHHQRRDQPSDSRDLAYRIDRMENTLNDVVQALRENTSTQGLSTTNLHNELEEIYTTPGPPDTNPVSHYYESAAVPSRDSLLLLAEIWLKHCECQPLPLFDERIFIPSFIDREPHLIFAVSAAASKFLSEDELLNNGLQGASQDMATADRLVMAQVSNGGVELSTLQAICILSLQFFDAGQLPKSRMLSTLAASLAHSAGLHRDLISSPSESTREERRRCYWSISILCRIFGDPDQLPMLFKEGNSAVPYPLSPNAPPPALRRTPGDGRTTVLSKPQGLGSVFCFTLQLSEIWHLAMMYVRRCRIPPAKDQLFPWSSESLYSKVTGALMDQANTTDLIHRYRSIKVSNLTHEILVEHHSYWQPWILARIMYHSLFCILNHPLLLTLQVHGVQDVADAFLYKTAFAISTHTSWIMHYLDLMTTRNFFLSDLLVIYMFGVVATIELQRCLSKDKEIYNRSRLNFDKCLKYITMMSVKWDYARRLGVNLRKLAAGTSALSQPYESEREGDLVVDVSKILDILDFPLSMAPEESRLTSIFGPGLQKGIFEKENKHHKQTRLPRILPVDKDLLEDTPATSDLSTNEIETRGRSSQDSSQLMEDTLITLPSNEFLLSPLQPENLWLDDPSIVNTFGYM